VLLIFLIVTNLKLALLVGSVGGGVFNFIKIYNKNNIDRWLNFLSIFGRFHARFIYLFICTFIVVVFCRRIFSSSVLV
jgi:hypothetical protein